MFPTKQWILNSLQQLPKYKHKGGYESGCASVSAQTRVQGRMVLGAVLQSWLLENVLRRAVTCCLCSSGVISCPPTPYSCSSWPQSALLSAYCFGRECGKGPVLPVLPSTPAPGSALFLPSGPGRKDFWCLFGSLMLSHIQHPLPKRSVTHLPLVKTLLYYVNLSLVASQPSLRTHDFRPQESSSAQQSGDLTGFYFNCMPWLDVTEGSDFRAALNSQISQESQNELWPKASGKIRPVMAQGNL